ncbi:MAG: hypothetical protein KA712_10870 [Myxococcales bacterium]|nr:hypothetical protein [Myxococcales bacterium]
MRRLSVGFPKARGCAIACGLMLGLGCGTVDLGPTPAEVNTCRPSQTFFHQRVWPELLAQARGGKTCGDARCHDAGSGRTLIVVAPTSTPTLPLPEDWLALYRSATAQLQCTDVAQSPLLMKIDGRQAHVGGKLVEPGGAERTLLQMWVEAP